MHVLPVDDAGCVGLDRTKPLRLDRPLTVKRLSERVDDAPDERLAHGHLDDPARPLDAVALTDFAVRTEDDATDVVFLEVEGHSIDPVLKFQQLARHGVIEPVDPGNTVTDHDDGSDVFHLNVAVEPLDLLL